MLFPQISNFICNYKFKRLYNNKLYILLIIHVSTQLSNLQKEITIR